METFIQASMGNLSASKRQPSLNVQMNKIFREHSNNSLNREERLANSCTSPIPSIIVTDTFEEDHNNIESLNHISPILSPSTARVTFLVGGSPAISKRFAEKMDDRIQFANGSNHKGTINQSLTSQNITPEQDTAFLSPNSISGPDSPETPNLMDRRHSAFRKQGRNETEMSSLKRKSLCPPSELIPRQLFIQLNELYLPTTVEGQMQWWETARWLKYEEDVEAGSERWGRPHVASLSFHSLLELRSTIEGGSVLLDLQAHDMYTVACAISKDLVHSEHLKAEDAQFVVRALMLPHKRVQDRQREIYDLRRQATYNSLEDYFYRQQSLLSPMPDVLVQRKRSASASSQVRFRNCVSKVITMNEAAQQFDRKQSVAFRKLSSVRLPNETASDVSFAVPTRKLMDTIEDKENESDNEAGESMLTQTDGIHVPRRRRSLLSTAYRICCCSLDCASKLSGLGRNSRKWKDRKTGRAIVLRPGTDLELLKRIPKGTEAGVVLVGAVDFLEKPVVCFVRLEQALNLPHVTEIPIPIRFIFILLGPLSAGIDYHEIGRSISTLLSTKSFCEAAYSATVREDLLVAIHDFLDDSIVLPPGDWDQKNLLPYEQIKTKSLWLNQRRNVQSEEDVFALFKKDPLARSGHAFGGLIQEARVRFPLYLSDFKDACHVKCLACIVFIFFACFFPALTFGNILEVGTSGTLGVKETLISTSLGGIVFALFSTQPLLLLGVCGPMLIYEQALYKFCKTYVEKKFYKEAFLQVRVWSGGWALVFCIFCVGFEGSFLIRYLTRFSDDILAALVALIFVSECFIFLINTYRDHPLFELGDYCNIGEAYPNTTYNVTSYCSSEACVDQRKPNVAVLSIVLVFATFFLAVILKSIRTSKFFGRQIRKAIGDFGLSLAIIVVVLFDLFLADNVTSKLDVGQGLFNYTLTVVKPWPISNAAIFAGSAVAGLFLFLVLFTENQVTEMMLSKKECGLRKGTGYHWDLLLSAILLFVCAVLKLPWLCAAPVRSHAHVNSLTKYKLRAPGQPPDVQYVVEQRVTGFILHLLIGLSLTAPDVLNIIPKAVLFGVFLYLGAMSLQGLQMLNRTILFFVPSKYHPCSVYCLRVQTRRMHAFTCLQLFLLTVVCSVKMIKPISFGFPIAIIGTVIIRHVILPRFFNNVELAALDSEEEHVDEDADFYSFSRIPL